MNLSGLPASPPVRVLLGATCLWASSCSPANIEERGSGLGHAEFLDTLPRVQVAADPSVVIGLAPEADEYVFGSILWAAIADDSLIVTGDPQARRVGMYGLDGSFRRWLGRTGEGPGEYGQPVSGGLTEDGHLWVYDFKRVTVFRTDGEPLRTIDVRQSLPVGSRRAVLGVDREGGIWFQRVTRLWEGLREGERYRARVAVHRLTSDSTSLVWEGDGDEEVFSRVEGGHGGGSSSLAPRLLTTVLDGELLMTMSDSSSLERVSADGVVRPWLDYPLAAVPVGDRSPRLQGPHRYDLLTEAFTFVPGNPGSSWLVLRSPFGAYHPLVHLTSEGAIEYVDPGETLFMPLFIGSDHALALNFSELDGHYVSLHALTR